METTADPKNNDRWFVCTENKPMKWSCTETTAQLAFSASEQIGLPRTTMAIPVSKMLPTILEKWYLRRMVNDHIVVSIKKNHEA